MGKTSSATDALVSAARPAAQGLAVPHSQVDHDNLPVRAVAAPRDVACQMCNIQPRKYKCPACATYTCSLKCCKQHKELTGCSGKADPFKANVSKSGLASEFGRDFRFIQDASRAISAARTCSVKLATPQRPPHRLMVLQQAAMAQQIYLLLLPPSMERQRINRSFFQAAGRARRQKRTLHARNQRLEVPAPNTPTENGCQSPTPPLHTATLSPEKSRCDARAVPHQAEGIAASGTSIDRVFDVPQGGRDCQSVGAQAQFIDTSGAPQLNTSQKHMARTWPSSGRQNSSNSAAPLPETTVALHSSENGLWQDVYVDDGGAKLDARMAASHVENGARDSGVDAEASGAFYWTVELWFQGQETAVVKHRVAATMLLSSLVQQEVAALPESLQRVAQEAGGSFSCLMRRPCAQAAASTYYMLDPARSLHMNLKARRILEFPSIHVVFGSVSPEYPVHTAGQDDPIPPDSYPQFCQFSRAHPWQGYVSQQTRARGGRGRGRFARRRALTKKQGRGAGGLGMDGRQNAARSAQTRGQHAWRRGQKGRCGEQVVGSQ